MPDASTFTASTLRRPDWYRTATRWTQLTLAENDPEKFDPDFWIDVFKRTGSNATCLSAGGYIAYYPSKVPLHYVSKFIGETDPFGALVEGARSLGMHVMARVDPHAIHQDAADAHPEWIAVDKDGNPRRHWAFPEVWVTCAYCDYNNLFMPEVVKEITRDYDIDAIFANRWQGHGICYCESCTRRFRDATGHDLPPSSNADDPVYRAWAGWRREVLTDMVIAWDNDVRAIKPHASFIPNMGGTSLMEFDLSLIEKHCPFLVVDDQGRQGVEAIWAAGRNGKRMRATFRERPVVLITSIGPEDEYRWKDSVNAPAETEAWITNGAVHGMLPWFTKFNGVVPDIRWIKPVADAYAAHAAMEPILSAMTPATEIGLIDPATTLRHWSRDERSRAEADELGFYHALIEAKLPFEMVSDQRLTPDEIDRFSVLILANARCLSDAQCDALKAYVERGGSLVVAGETALADENANPRDSMALADLLGAKITTPLRGPVKNTYIALNGAHPLTEGFGGAERLIGGTHLIGAEPTANAEAPFLTFPDFPDLPMEEVYFRDPPREAAVITRQHGAGRTVYIPWNIGGIFWQALAADHQRLIENAVRWALTTRPWVEVSGHSVLDIAVRKNPDGLAVLMQNLTNPHMLKGPTRAIFPVGAHRISVALPEGRSGAEAKLLGGTTLPVTVVDGRANVDIPEIALAEALHLSWR